MTSKRCAFLEDGELGYSQKELNEKKSLISRRNSSNDRIFLAFTLFNSLSGFTAVILVSIIFFFNMTSCSFMYIVTFHLYLALCLTELNAD